MKRSLFKKNDGFSLVEMLIYIAILSFLLVIIINLLSGLLTSQRNLKSAKNIENSGIYGFERMVREIRDAKNIDTSNSQLNTNPGVLVLNTTDENNVDRTVEFFVSNETLHIKENGVDLGPLTPKNASVTNLIFRSVDTANSEAVKIEFTAESGSGQFYKQGNFYSTAILRSSY